ADGCAGETYHLTAGADASTIGEIAQLASRYFRRPLPRVLSPAEFGALEPGSSERTAIESSRAYFPYFSIGTVFDQATTCARLDPAGICVSPLREYMECLLDFATQSRWGKRPIARFDALMACPVTPPPPGGLCPALPCPAAGPRGSWSDAPTRRCSPI